MDSDPHVQPALIGVAYLLVKHCDWSAWRAVGVVALMVPLIIATVICLFAPAEGRRTFWPAAPPTVAEDIKHIFDILTFRK